MAIKPENVKLSNWYLEPLSAHLAEQMIDSRFSRMGNEPGWTVPYLVDNVHQTRSFFIHLEEGVCFEDGCIKEIREHYIQAGWLDLAVLCIAAQDHSAKLTIVLKQRYIQPVSVRKPGDDYVVLP